jgi:hypothetical protein
VCFGKCHRTLYTLWGTLEGRRESLLPYLIRCSKVSLSFSVLFYANGNWLEVSVTARRVKSCTTVCFQPSSLAVEPFIFVFMRFPSCSTLVLGMSQEISRSLCYIALY